MAILKALVVLSSAIVTCNSLTIVETAQGNSDFSVLVEALIKADLVDTLSGEGPFTVFAPTNAAFTAALTSMGITKEQLLAMDELGNILKYHVLAGSVPSSALKEFQAPMTVLGLKVIVTKDDDPSIGVKYGGRSVTSADLACSNGLIHVIDMVAMPASMNIVQTAQTVNDFSVLVAAVVKADLATFLSGEGPFTVFAPTNGAFEALGIQPEVLLARSDLAAILKYHVLSGQIFAGELAASQTPTTMLDQKVTVTRDMTTNAVTYHGASVIVSDLLCSNGVIHVIDKVVMPPAGGSTDVKCGDIKAAYKSSKCCGMPDSPFHMPTRRLSNVEDDIVGTVQARLEDARKVGGDANAKKLAQSIDDLLAQYK